LNTSIAVSGHINAHILQAVHCSFFIISKLGRKISLYIVFFGNHKYLFGAVCYAKITSLATVTIDDYMSHGTISLV